MADEKLRKTERDKRLDELEKAVTKYGKEKKKVLEADVKFMKSVIKTRTGAGKLANQGVADSKKLLADSISQFLEG
jgi:ribonuclease HII